MGKLDKADTQVTTLESNVTSLQGELTAAQANVTSIQAQLDAEKAKSASLQTQLTTSDAKVTSLTADLAAANAKVTSTQVSLDKANADLATAKASNTSLSAELTKVKDPRHFNTLQELTDWLAKDDTNTNSAYASLTNIAKAYVLEVKALRDGYLLPAQLDIVQFQDGSYAVLGSNIALIGPNIYSVAPATDVVSVSSISFNTALPSHPLPLS